MCLPNLYITLIIISEANDDWLSEKNYKMIKQCFSKDHCHIPSVTEFKKRYRRKLFKGGKLSLPNYCLGKAETLFHIRRAGTVEHKRKVVFMKRAKNIVKELHQQTNEGNCVPGGINTLVRSFTATYYFKGIRKIVRDVLNDCTGTCKLSKVQLHLLLFLIEPCL